jgi:hypothetical protein
LFLIIPCILIDHKDVATSRLAAAARKRRPKSLRQGLLTLVSSAAVWYEGQDVLLRALLTAALCGPQAGS